MEDQKKSSAARIRANNKYNAKAYEEFKIRVFKGNKKIIKQYCTDKNTSVNGLVNQLLHDKLSADGYELFTEPTANKAD